MACLLLDNHGALSPPVNAFTSWCELNHRHEAVRATLATCVVLTPTNPAAAAFTPSLNDPDTNACGYKGLSGQPSSSRRRTPSSQGPAPERRLTSSQQPGVFFDGVGDVKEAERPTGSDAAFDADFFAFREKDALAGVKRRREVERRRRSAAGVAGGGEGSAVKVELATQLGLPASSSYDEVWSNACIFGVPLVFFFGGGVWVTLFKDTFTVACGFPGWCVVLDSFTPNSSPPVACECRGRIVSP